MASRHVRRREGGCPRTHVLELIDAGEAIAVYGYEIDLTDVYGVYYLAGDGTVTAAQHRG